MVDNHQNDNEPSVDTAHPISDDEEEEDFHDAVRPVTPSIPVCCLREGLLIKQSGWEADSWVALATSLDGRDKITKVFQYLARFLAWYLAGRSRHAVRFAAMRKSLTTSRKAFRLGRTFIEFQKLRQMGVFAALAWYFKSLRTSSVRGGSANGNAFSGILNSLTTSVLGEAPEQSPRTPLWQTLGMAIKTLGLLGFWAGDNVAFLTSSGIFDNLRDHGLRDVHRKSLVTRAGLFANRSYFAGAVAGLVVNLRSYWQYRQEKLRALRESSDDINEERQAIVKTKEFLLFVALVKSCCDVLVFSNNAGVDLWKLVAGRKLHEGLHCVAGLTSAATVLYNKFPNQN